MSTAASIAAYIGELSCGRCHAPVHMYQAGGRRWYTDTRDPTDYHTRTCVKVKAYRPFNPGHLNRRVRKVYIR